MIDWHSIDTVFLDMDGTLLDLHFDNHFWLEHLPKRYGEKFGLPMVQARDELLHRYRGVQGSLAWYCVDHWTRVLGLDVAMLKAELEHLIVVHPHVVTFLQELQRIGKKRVLVSNAHPKSIALKMAKTSLHVHLERIISAHDLGLSKEHPDFWAQLQTIEPFDPKRTLFVDDTVSALTSARDYGMFWLLGVSKPDSHGPAKIMPNFPSISDFSEIGLITA